MGDLGSADLQSLKWIAVYGVAILGGGVGLFVALVLGFIAYWVFSLRSDDRASPSLIIFYSFIGWLIALVIAILVAVAITSYSEGLNDADALALMSVPSLGAILGILVGQRLLGG